MYPEHEQTSEEGLKFCTWKIHWLTHSYTNCVSLFHSSTYVTLFWKTVSELLWGWTKRQPVQCYYCWQIYALLFAWRGTCAKSNDHAQVHSLIGEHSWTGILNSRNPAFNKFQTQPDVSRSACCFWMSVCTWILHSLITGTSRNMVKVFNTLNSWHSLRIACMPDLFFPKWDRGIFHWQACLVQTSKNK